MGSFALWNCVCSVLLSFSEWERLKTRRNLFSFYSCLDWPIHSKKITKVSAELILVKTLYFFNIQLITKAGRNPGKRQTAWERWNWLLLAEVFPVLIHSPSPKQLLDSSEDFRKLFQFFVCCFTLSMSYFMPPGASYRDNIGIFQQKVALGQG